MTPLLVAVAVAVAAAAPQGDALVVDPVASVVRFHLEHKLHKVDGRSAKVEGKAVIGADGRVMAMVRIPVTSFETGDANRDSHMRETLEVARYPFVVLKGLTSLTVPVAHGKPVEARLRGELELHGVKQPVDLPVQISFDADGGATVRAKFPVSLEAHRIERPSLLFVKVDDQLLMDVELRMKGEAR
jgi:polyisoprenoid-binding protein YceI